MCKCQDTGSKRCRKEWSTPSSWNLNRKELAKTDRKAVKAALTQVRWARAA